MCSDIYSAEGEERWRSALTAVPARMSWQNTGVQEEQTGVAFCFKHFLKSQLGL